MFQRLASLGVVTSALSLAAVASGDVPHELPKSGADPIATPVVRPQVYDLSFKSCWLGSPNKAVTAMTELTKAEGAIVAWEGSLAAPTPLGGADHFFYGTTNAHCPRMWVTDFTVSSATTAKLGNNTPITAFTPYYHAGDRARAGKYVPLNEISETQLLTSTERSGCDTSSHTYKGQSYPTKQKCYDAASKDVCSRLLRRSVAAFKKDGTTEFKTYLSSFGGFLWDGSMCAPSSRFSFQMFDPTYDNSNASADALRKLPVPAGRKDVYRIAAGLFLYTKPLTVQDGNAADHGKSSGDALFLFNPKVYSPNDNPLIEQLPIEGVLKPG